jgi:hypothetical protein
MGAVTTAATLGASDYVAFARPFESVVKANPERACR